MVSPSKLPFGSAILQLTTLLLHSCSRLQWRQRLRRGCRGVPFCPGHGWGRLCAHTSYAVWRGGAEANTGNLQCCKFTLFGR